MGPAKNCVALAALCMVAGCAGTNSSSPPPGRVGAASYQMIPCPQPNIAGFADLDFPSGIQCGYLAVLEKRTNPEGRRIRVFVMRAPAVSATPRRDPVVYLSGGPGGAGSFEVAFMVKHGLNADREVIFVDQRGTHRADPRLGCPGWEQFGYDSVSLPFASESTAAAEATTIKLCRDQLAAAGIYLAAYNSTEMMADMARGDPSAVPPRISRSGVRRNSLDWAALVLPLPCSARSTPISRPRQPLGEGKGGAPRIPGPCT